MRLNGNAKRSANFHTPEAKAHQDAVTLRGRAHYGRIDEIAEYVFQFIRTSEGELLKFGAVAFSKSEDRALARQVIDIFGNKT